MAVVVVIAAGQAPANVRLAKVISRSPGNVLEAAFTVVQKQLGRLLEGDAGVSFLANIARHVAIDHGDVKTAITIDIKKASAEAEHQPTRRSETGAGGDVQE